MPTRVISSIKYDLAYSQLISQLNLVRGGGVAVGGVVVGVGVGVVVGVAFACCCWWRSWRRG